MRRVLFLLISLIISVSTTGQIIIEDKSSISKSVTIGNVKNGPNVLATLTYEIQENNDTVCKLVFKDFKYQTLEEFQSVSFLNKGNTLESFYKILKSFFSEENKKNKKYSVNIKLGNEDVNLNQYRALGIGAVILNAKSGYVYFTENQVEKLFGKKK